MYGVQKYWLFTTEFNHVVAVREMNTFHIFIIFVCFNVALQDLGPIGPNYILVVGVFDF